MKECKKCGDSIPATIRIDGRKRNLKNRQFCFGCSPFGQHNTRDITKPRAEPKKKKSKTSGEAVKKYRLRLKFKLIAYKGGKCQRCGYNKPIPNVYVFHHRDPKEKSFGIAESMCRALDVMKKEVDKCDMLCRNCHAEVHFEMAGKLTGVAASC